MVAEVGSEPGVGSFGRGPGWDIDLGRVRLGYDMVRIRVRRENRRLGDYLTYSLEWRSRVHIQVEKRESNVCLFGQNGRTRRCLTRNAPFL